MLVRSEEYYEKLFTALNLDIKTTNEMGPDKNTTERLKLYVVVRDQVIESQHWDNPEKN